MILESIFPLTIFIWMSLTFVSQWMEEWRELQCERVLFEVTRNALDSPEKYRAQKEISILRDRVEGKKSCRSVKEPAALVRFHFMQELRE